LGRYDSLYVKPLQRASSSWANSIVDALNELYDMASSALRVYNIVRVTGDYAANPYDMVLADASSAPVTVTLPVASGKEVVVVKKVDSTANKVNIVPQQGKTVDGAPSLTLAQPMKSVVLIADQSGNWWVVAGY